MQRTTHGVTAARSAGSSQRALFAAALFAAAAFATGCSHHGSGNSPAPAPTTPVAPQILLQPGGHSIPVATSVSFNFSVFGTGPFTYQWRRNGVDISGATGASYAVVNAALTDDGARFSVLVANSVGSVTSNEAVLNVFAAPVATVSCATSGATDSEFAPATVTVGKSAVAAIASCTPTGGTTSGALTNVQWTQTAGPVTVPLPSDKSQAISFEPPQAGTYTFDVAFTDPGSNAQTRTVNINASAPATTNSTVVARVNQATRMNSSVSLRAWPNLVSGDSVASIRWDQIEGPAVQLDTSDPYRAIISTPGVAEDTLLRFRVTMTTALGTTDSDDAWVLVEYYNQAPLVNNAYAFSNASVSRVHPYVAAGPYAANLVRCVYDANLQWTSNGTGTGQNTCPLSTLPLLAQDTAGALPTVAQVMNRVVVSHDWMGQVFEQFLTTQDGNGDFRQLLNGVTAIVIGSQIKPSFYYVLTGALYLDAENFWLTPEQRDVISEQAAFQTNFDGVLQFSTPWRYTQSNLDIVVPYPAANRVMRDVSYVLVAAGHLLYHELAHAGDFFPPAMRTTLDPTLAPWDNVIPRFNAAQLPSDLVKQQYPLASLEMTGLALVKFFGVTANSTQVLYTPVQVGGFFSADRANDPYSYTTSREDAAMLFEEFMMSYRQGVTRDVAVTDKITPSTTNSTLIVRWGERGRVGETTIRPRLQLMVQNVAPWLDAVGSVAALPAPIAMRAGDTWANNLIVSLRQGGMKQSPPAPSKAQDAALLSHAQLPPGRAPQDVALSVGQ